MTVVRKIVYALFAFAVASTSLPAAEPDAPDFKEVYELLKTNLAGADDAALDRAAVQGLLEKLSPRVTLLSDAAAAGAGTKTPLLIKASVVDGAYAYLRVGNVLAGLAEQMSAAFRSMAATNKLKGVVIDLRYAGGQDYAAAATAADAFFADEQPLLDWGDGVKKSTAKSDSITIPVALLVNQKTAGSAEALAGILRQADVGLLIGAHTAGQASIAKEFTLKTGQRLRVATGAIKIGKSQTLSLAGLKPDIAVSVNAEDELAWFDDAYKVFPKTNQIAAANNVATNETTLAGGTNRPRRRLNEAELVRMVKEGQNPDLDLANPRPRETDTPRVLNDPALARAIDLLKGLAVVQQFRSI